MGLLNILTDDQVALMGCVLALTVCGTVMLSISTWGSFCDGCERAGPPNNRPGRHMASQPAVLPPIKEALATKLHD